MKNDVKRDSRLLKIDRTKKKEREEKNGFCEIDFREPRDFLPGYPRVPRLRCQKRGKRKCAAHFLRVFSKSCMCVIFFQHFSQKNTFAQHECLVRVEMCGDFDRCMMQFANIFATPEIIDIDEFSLWN